MGVIQVVHQTLADFMSHTTIGGLCNAAIATSRVRQAYWIIIFTVLTALTLQSLVGVIQQYLAYDVITSTDLSYSNTLSFPAITVCNQNRVHCINLFEYTIDLGQNLTSTNSTSDLDLQKRIDQLDDILKTTGCMDQICLSLSGMIPAVRNSSNPTGDVILMKIVTIRCPISLDQSFACYNLLGMNRTATNTTSPSMSDVSSGWSFFQCSLDLACRYRQFSLDFVKPKECPQNNDRFGPGSETTLSPTAANTTTPGPAATIFSVDTITTTTLTTTTSSTISSLVASNATTIAGGPAPFLRKKRAPGSGGPGGPGGGTARQPPPVNADFQSASVFLSKYMELREEDRKAIGHSIADSESKTFGTVYGFLYSCTYKGRDCSDVTYWFIYTTPKYGNCFTFNTMENAANDDDVPRQASLTGRDNGLSVELFLDQDNYMLQKLSKTAGAKIVIHDPTLPPLPDEYGIDMQPNTASSVAVQTSNITRQPAPYVSNCINTWADTDYNINPSVNYSLASCQRFALQNDILKECQCFHPYLVQPGLPMEIELLPVEVPPCLITPSSNETSDFHCFTDIIDEYNNGARTTSCNVSCSELQFTSAVSTSTWPSDQYWIFLAAEMVVYADKITSSEPLVHEQIKSEIQKNYAKAEVFFQTLNVVNINQSPLLDVIGLVSALGGSLGLFTGVAIIMLFEIVELLWDIFFNIWLYMSQPKEPRKTKVNSF